MLYIKPKEKLIKIARFYHSNNMYIIIGGCFYYIVKERNGLLFTFGIFLICYFNVHFPGITETSKKKKSKDRCAFFSNHPGRRKKVKAREHIRCGN